MLFFQNRWLRYEAVLCHGSSLYDLKPPQRPAWGLTAEPDKKTAPRQGLLRGSCSLMKTPGGWLLPAARRQAPNSVNARPSRWAQQSPGNWAPSLKPELICSSSAQISTFCQGYLLWFHFFIPACVSFFFISLLSLFYFLNPSLASSSLSPSPSVSAVFSFKVHIPFPLNPLQVRHIHPLLFCWDTAFPHKSDKPCISLLSEMRQLWDRGVRSLPMNIWRMLM